jgi:hypothetical protein
VDAEVLPEDNMEDIVIKSEPIDPLNLDLEEDVNLETTTPNLDVTVSDNIRHKFRY